MDDTMTYHLVLVFNYMGVIVFQVPSALYAFQASLLRVGLIIIILIECVISAFPVLTFFFWDRPVLMQA